MQPRDSRSSLRADGFPFLVVLGFFLWLDELVDTTFNRVALVRVELAISGRCRTSIGVGEAICNYLHSVPLKGGPGNLSQVVPGI